ncbi:hypothetical protein A2U01_0112655, partial [Trifolium medium]|nr:hypothetical protein [Trifolium medium]
MLRRPSQYKLDVEVK